MVCDNGVVVITPEPTSLENAADFMWPRRSADNWGPGMVSAEVRKVVALAMDERDGRGN